MSVLDCKLVKYQPYWALPSTSTLSDMKSNALHVRSALQSSPDLFFPRHPLSGIVRRICLLPIPFHPPAIFIVVLRSSLRPSIRSDLSVRARTRTHLATAAAVARLVSVVS